MSQILNKLRDVDPCDSDAVKETVTAFFQNLSKYINNDCNRWLRALENVVNRFPKYCGQHRVAAETYLCHFLESTNYYNVIEAAKCAHVLQQVRPPQSKTATAKSCWRDQMSMLCEAALKIIDTLFARPISKKDATQDTDKSTFLPLQRALKDIDTITTVKEAANKNDILCTRLTNVLVFMQAMLVEVYPVAKPIQPQSILDLILNCFSASGNQDSPNVASIKIQALRTLDALISCLGSNLIPFSALVFKIAMQTLRWSSENTSQESRKVRRAVYGSVSEWLRTLHVHKAGTWDQELTSHVLRDVTPLKHTVQLNMGAQPMKNLSKKARKKMANTLLKQSNISVHMPGEKNKNNVSEESNEEVAIAAIECAESFLITCGIFLKPITHKQLQELLVRECYNIEEYSTERGLWLLRALEASRKGCSPTSPPPTQHCLQLYSALATSTRTNRSKQEISKFCSEALLDIRLHLHCSPPSLNFALEVRELKDNREDKRKRISERNRAALEGLLGKNRIPPAEIEEEIITLSDEPSTKKPRIDDVAEKISLSSGPESSVVISDDSSQQSQDEDVNHIIDDEQSNSDVEITEVNTDKELLQPSQPLSNAEQPDQKVIGNGKFIVNDTESDYHEMRVMEYVNNAETQIEHKEKESNEDIFNAKTQLPLSMSNDTVDGDKSPLSMEVVYDYPNMGKGKINVIEKIEDENLPSTGDTDDVPITCGQHVKSSQEPDSDKNKESELPVRENGLETSPVHIVENGHVTEEEKSKTDVINVEANGQQLTIDEMLADFVDEVNEDALK